MTKLRDIYARDGLAFSIEFFPPKTEQGKENLFSELQELKTLDPAFVSVTYGAGGSTGSTTMEVVKRMHFVERLDVMAHLTVVGQPQHEVTSILAELWGCGIDKIIALGGDPPGGPSAPWTQHPDGYRNATELVNAARRGQSGWYDFFSIAVAGFPEIHPRAQSREQDRAIAKAKADAGAELIITQLFFDNDDYYRYVEELRALGVTVPIVPGMLPIRSAAQVRRFTELCGSRIPPRLATLLEKVQDDDEAAIQLGIDYATQQCQELLEFGVPGFHFYSLNRAQSVAAIHENLNLGALTRTGGTAGA